MIQVLHMLKMHANLKSSQLSGQILSLVYAGIAIVLLVLLRQSSLGGNGGVWCSNTMNIMCWSLSGCRKNVV